MKVDDYLGALTVALMIGGSVGGILVFYGRPGLGVLVGIALIFGIFWLAGKSLDHQADERARKREELRRASRQLDDE